MAHAMPARVVAPTPAEPTSLLIHVAGSLAPRIAGHWPAPHTGFFALPTARRHAAAMLIAMDADGALDFGGWIAHARDSEVVKLMAPKAGKRFMRKLSRMGERLWTPEEYAALRALLEDDAARKLLGHLREITPLAIRVSAELPAALRVPGIVGQISHPRQAQRLTLGYEIAVMHLKQVRPRDLAERLSRAEDIHALGRMAADATLPQRFGRPGPPPELPAPFGLVADRAALERTAVAFENCLRDYVDRMARGMMAVYVWNGDPPVVLALCWDPAGWRLAEAEIKANDDVPEPVLQRIVDAVTAEGVRVGPSLAEIRRRLDCLADANTAGACDRGELYDRLDLGDLWD